MYYFQALLIFLIFLLVQILQEQPALAAIPSNVRPVPVSPPAALSRNKDVESKKFDEVSLTKTPRTFSFEAQTPQRVIVGCRGTQLPNGQLKTIFYIIDATGRKKYVEPGQVTNVVFPKTDEAPTSGSNVASSKYVGFHEMCFPSECNSPNCGFTIGPLPFHPPLGPNDAFQGIQDQIDALIAAGSASAAAGASSSSSGSNGGGSCGGGGGGGTVPGGPGQGAGWIPDVSGGSSAGSESGSSGTVESGGSGAAAGAGASAGASSGGSSSGSGSSGSDSGSSTGAGASAGASAGAAGAGAGAGGASSGSGSNGSGGSGGEEGSWPSGGGASGGSSSGGSGGESGNGGSGGGGSSGGGGGSSGGGGGSSGGSGGESGNGGSGGGGSSGGGGGSSGGGGGSSGGGGGSSGGGGGSSGGGGGSSGGGGGSSGGGGGSSGGGGGSSGGGGGSSGSWGTTGNGGGSCPQSCTCCHLCNSAPPSAPPSTSLPPPGTSFPPAGTSLPINHPYYPSPTAFVPGAPWASIFGTKESIGKDLAKDRTDAGYYSSLPGAILGAANVIYYPSCERDAYVQPAIINYCPASDATQKMKRQSAKTA